MPDSATPRRSRRDTIWHPNEYYEKLSKAYEKERGLKRGSICQWNSTRSFGKIACDDVGYIHVHVRGILGGVPSTQLAIGQRVSFTIVPGHIMGTRQAWNVRCLTPTPPAQAAAPTTTPVDKEGRRVAAAAAVATTTTTTTTLVTVAAVPQIAAADTAARVAAAAAEHERGETVEGMGDTTIDTASGRASRVATEDEKQSAETDGDAPSSRVAGVLNAVNELEESVGCVSSLRNEVQEHHDSLRELLTRVVTLETEVAARAEHHAKGDDKIAQEVSKQLEERLRDLVVVAHTNIAKEVRKQLDDRLPKLVFRAHTAA